MRKLKQAFQDLKQSFQDLKTIIKEANSEDESFFWKASFNIFAGLVISLAILLIIAGPFISIWSLNTLFGLKIAYGFFEWLAMLWVGVVLFPKNTKKE